MDTVAGLIGLLSAAFWLLSVRTLGLRWGSWYALCELFGAFVLFPLGLVLVGAASVARAWTAGAPVTSIKPIDTVHGRRTVVDAWRWNWMNALYGNPEDGVTGIDAYGPSWKGAYNMTYPPSRWVAFKWAGLRNWAAGYNYLTSRAPAPIYFGTYTLFGKVRTVKLGWQQLPASDGWIGPYKQRMVCSI